VKAASEVFSSEKPGGQRYAPERHVLLREFHADLATSGLSVYSRKSMEMCQVAATGGSDGGGGMMAEVIADPSRT